MEVEVKWLAGVLEARVGGNFLRSTRQSSRRGSKNCCESSGSLMVGGRMGENCGIRMRWKMRKNFVQ